jgi:alpha-L-fucosidase 2
MYIKLHAIYSNILIILAVSLSGFAQTRPLKLWYDKPASQWEETLPLGNGRLGMTPDGGVSTEKIVLNDITLWSGGPQDANNYEAYKKLPEIRRLLGLGKNDEAQQLIDKDFVCVGPGSAGKQWGCFHLLADLNIEYQYPGQATNYSRYTRSLSLDSAIAETSFELNGITYRREYFTSFSGDLDVIRITASQKKAISLRVSISRPEKGVSTIVNNSLQLTGQLDNGTDGKGMQYTAQVSLVNTGGQRSAGENKLTIRNADEVIILVSAATSFLSRGYKNDLAKNMEAALSTVYSDQKSAHIHEYRKLFARVNVDLGRGRNSTLPTDKRITSYYSNPQDDAELPALFFQYGRYLSISSTRVGLLPPNLQGLWANQIQTPWNGDYHLDVNVQMNHWPLELANLSELNLPLADLVGKLVTPGTKTAKAYYNAEGWVAHVITNVWGYTEPGEQASWGITKAGSGWLCNNLWEHFAYTRDTAYLRKIYPILEGSARFYKSILVRDSKTGWLVTSPSSSPENSFILPNGKHASICVGATIDNQIIRELFSNVIQASHILKARSPFADSVQALLKKLPPAGVIGSDGRLMEWLEEYQESDPQHRHISHLYGLYPANQITPSHTPALAEAARNSLNVRGDDGPSWAIAYKQIFWTRLLDGNRAFKLFREILKPTLRTDINYGAGGGVYPNLLSAGPPFQIDGNFGATAGLGEMLLQSHAGYIELLPAIPDLWKGYGNVTGFRARGNYTIDMEWRNGQITAYKVSSPERSAVKVKVNGVLKEIESEKLKP